MFCYEHESGSLIAADLAARRSMLSLRVGTCYQVLRYIPTRSDALLAASCDTSLRKALLLIEMIIVALSTSIFLLLLAYKAPRWLLMYLDALPSQMLVILRMSCVCRLYPDLSRRHTTLLILTIKAIVRM